MDLKDQYESLVLVLAGQELYEKHGQMKGVEKHLTFKGSYILFCNNVSTLNSNLPSIFDKEKYPLTDEIISSLKNVNNPTKAYLDSNNNITDAAIGNALFDKFTDIKRHIVNAMNPAFKKWNDDNPSGMNLADMMYSIREQTYKYEEEEKKKNSNQVKKIILEEEKN